MLEGTGGQLEGGSSFSMGLSIVSMEAGSQAFPHITHRVKEAHLLALSAYSNPQPGGQAEAALAIDPRCPEAWNVLALFKASSFEQALQYFQKAVELGPKVSSPPCVLPSCADMARCRVDVSGAGGAPKGTCCRCNCSEL